MIFITNMESKHYPTRNKISIVYKTHSPHSLLPSLETGHNKKKYNTIQYNGKEATENAAATAAMGYSSPTTQTPKNQAIVSNYYNNNKQYRPHRHYHPPPSPSPSL